MILRRVMALPDEGSKIWSQLGHLYCLELKTLYGTPTAEQVQTLQELQRAGAQVAVTYGLEEAIKKLETWGLIHADAYER